MTRLGLPRHGHPTMKSEEPDMGFIDKRKGRYRAK
jgi:hypothetical protein